MKVNTAQLLGGDDNADRLFVTDHAVIVLDGASASEPVDVDPGAYAATVGAGIADQLAPEPGVDLLGAVARAITYAVSALDLAPARSSSTVSILRVHQGLADLYVLGDSPIYFGTAGSTYGLTDSRLADLPLPEPAAYAAALRSGRGYGEEHRELIRALRRAERRHRNTERGYWIAETTPGRPTRAPSRRRAPRRSPGRGSRDRRCQRPARPLRPPGLGRDRPVRRRRPRGPPGPDRPVAPAAQAG